jgi:hypothetical protein
LPSLHGVWVAVTVFAWCGVRVRVIVHGCWGRRLCMGYGVGVGVIVWGVGCACCFCMGCGVRVGVRVIAQRVVSRPQSLSGMWVVLAIFMQCVVSCSWLLHGMLLPPGYAGELPQLGDRCDCMPEWRCDPHDACFIHDLCFCDSSGSWPPVKPVCVATHYFIKVARTTRDLSWR